MFDASAVMHGYIHEGIAAIVLSVGGWILVFPVRTFLSSIKDAWHGQTKLLSDCISELTNQRTNHLKHIEDANEKQVDLLEKVSETLTDMHLDQRTLLGRFDRHE